MEFQIKNEKELKNIVTQLLQEIKGEHSNKAVVVALSGDLGAGKTTFTKTFAKEIGVDEHVASPTFVIERVYPITFSGFTNFSLLTRVLAL